MIDNFGKGGFGLDQLTELIPTEPSEADREQTKRILESKRRELEKYLIEHPEVVAVHAIPQPNGSFHGRVYGETYLDENGSKNLRIHIK